MKKVLYLTFYYEPDLCAGSFRNTPLSKELAKQLEGIGEIDLITTMPNRYSSYQANPVDQAETYNLSVTRIQLPVHKSGFLDQINAFKTYFFSVLSLTRGKKYDMVFVSSSRLFTAVLGYVLARKNKAKFYIDVRDIFVDTIEDVVTNKLATKLMVPILRLIEKKVFGSANHINLISEGFKNYFTKYTNCSYSYFSNGIDNEFIFDSDYAELLPKNPFIITYAGNLGEGQGLHNVVPLMAQKLGSNYLIQIIGDGGAKPLLEAALEKHHISNVKIMPPIKRAALIEVYKQSNFLFLHLNNHKAFEKVLPSKVFEYGALSRPVIAGVNGFAKDFIEKNIPDSIVFQPNNAEDFYAKFSNYHYKLPNSQLFIDKFKRDNINKEMAKSIIAII